MTPSTFHAFAVAVLFTFFFACTSASLQKENAYYSSGAPGTITTTPTTAFHGNAFSKKLAVARSSRHTTLASPNEKKDGFICHTRSGEGEEIECTTASRRTLLSGLWSQIAVASAAAVGVGLVDPRASYAAEGKSIEEVRKGVEADFVSRWERAAPCLLFYYMDCVILLLCVSRVLSCVLERGSAAYL